MKRGFFLNCIIFLLFSCGDGNKFYSTDMCLITNNQNRTKTVALHSVSDISSYVNGLLCIDNYLVVIQQNKDSVFKIIDTRNDSVVSCFGKVGHSGDEFLNIPQRVYFVRGKDGHPLLCVQEKMHTKIIDLIRSIKYNKCFINAIIKENKDFLFYYTFHLPDGNCLNYKKISYEDARDNVYIKPIFYIDGESKMEWDVFPNIITSDFPNLFDCAYSMNVQITPTGKYVVGIQNFIDIVTIINIDRNKSIGIINPSSYTLEDMESDFNKKNISENLKWYNTSSCVTDHCFMVLKDGRFYRDVVNEDSESGNSVIYTYDWNGKLLSSYTMNKRVTNIAYCDITNKLYVIGSSNKLYSCILK